MPCLIRRHAEVLTAEGGIVADALEDDLCVGILHHQPRAAARLTRVGIADQQFALLLAFIVTTEHAGQPGHQRAFAGARSTK